MKVRRLVAGISLVGLLATGGCASAPSDQRRPPASAGIAVPTPIPMVPTEPQHAGVAYAGDTDPSHQLDLYAPVSSAKGPHPLVIFVHGGAWSFGSRAMPLDAPSGFGAFRANLQARGYAVASVSYRFVDKGRFPTQLEDVKAAVRFLRTHAKEYGLDPDRFVIAGESAGGELALLTGLTSGHPEMEGPVGVQAVSSGVRAVIDYYGVTDLTTIEADRRAAGCGVRRNPELSGEWRLVGGDPAGPVAGPLARQASPLTWAGATGVPLLVFQGTKDCTVPQAQAQRMVDAQRASGAMVEYYTIAAGHAAPDFFTDGTLQADVIAFLAQYDA